MRAWLQFDHARCGKCGQIGGVRPVPHTKAKPGHWDVSWVGDRGARPDETPDLTVRVSLARCLYCGSTEAVRAEWEERHKDDERPPGGGALAKDGLIFYPHSPDEED